MPERNSSSKLSSRRTTGTSGSRGKHTLAPLWPRRKRTMVSRSRLSS